MTAALRLGVLRLADSAPAVLAEAEGLFAAEGVEVALQVEPSWANVADKLAWGMLDAAIMLPPLALAMAAGLRGRRTGLIVPMGISRGGNSVVVARDVPAGADLAPWLRSRAQPPRFAVVHGFSTHNLLLRHWLAAGGIDPDRAVEIVVVPPDRVVGELAAGRIAGFCAGAPWGEVAAEQGVGQVLLGTSSIRPGHPEKCLALAEGLLRSRPGEVAALLRALLRAQRLCADPALAPELAALLAARLALPQAAVRLALPGGGATECIGFAGADAITVGEALWFLAEMRRWGWLEDGADDAAFAARVYRPDVLAELAVG
ncbi:Nitrate ABC transporter, nitrate-binding protein [Rhodovastum atsumiense]|uniref:ABC transporter substrate-binding protein n=1 Tax=Rhodovastum atsumiense TaxID=504468 RepID=A0A5M6IQH1_9PROT|nr:ABC transporter substrate-binding protein [Rhodovastum atsumiense]KAA5610526.1 ABC transporter substrate-binding protein [Rhodovastum atsumiense]CAH2605029.1 Nitrate ABC transporter, nitrate-binding protein [Rhodovastum atsumiense]